MFANACREYLNNLNNFIISRPTTGLAKHLNSMVKYNKDGTVNSVEFWQELEDYVKPGFLSDPEYRSDIDDMIMTFGYYKKELLKIIGTVELSTDWINWYCSLSPEKVKVIDGWYETKIS